MLATFYAVDGAVSLKVALPNGRVAETRQVLAFDRWTDWALLKVEAAGITVLPKAPAYSWSVGDRYFYLDVAPEGSRTTSDSNIRGANTFPRSGPRLNLATLPARLAIGSALFNEFGEVIGILGGMLTPGASSLESLREIPGYSGTANFGVRRSGLAIPLTAINLPAPGVEGRSLADLASSGQFVPLVSPPWPKDPKEVFSHKDPKMVTFIVWEPKEKRKAMAVYRLFDVENRLVGETKPSKCDLRPGARLSTYWEGDVHALTVGVYRIDILLDSEITWRGFSRVTD